MTCPIHNDTLKKLTTRAYEYLKANPKKWMHQRYLRESVGGTFEYYQFVMLELAKLPNIKSRKILFGGVVKSEVRFEPSF